MTVESSLSEATEKMHKATAHLKEDLATVRTGRAAPSPSARLLVDPLRCLGVPLDLEILLELLVPDCHVARKQRFHLLQHEGVALNRGRVMGFVEPDASPDLGGFLGGGQATDIAQCGHLALNALMQGAA